MIVQVLLERLEARVRRPLPLALEAPPQGALVGRQVPFDGFVRLATVLPSARRGARAVGREEAHQRTRITSAGSATHPTAKTSAPSITHLRRLSVSETAPPAQCERFAVLTTAPAGPAG